MKTVDIMEKRDLGRDDCDFITVSEVLKFCQRMFDRVDDISNGMNPENVRAEIKQVMNKLLK